VTVAMRDGKLRTHAVGAWRTPRADALRHIGSIVEQALTE